MIIAFVLLVVAIAQSSALAAEVSIDVGESRARVLCVDSDGEYTITSSGSGVVRITLLDGYAWGCRYGTSQVFYDLSMPPAGMVGGVEVFVDFDIGALGWK